MIVWNDDRTALTNTVTGKTVSIVITRSMDGDTMVWVCEDKVNKLVLKRWFKKKV